MQVGDLVSYGTAKYEDGSPVIGTVLFVNDAGGTLKVLDKHGTIDWFVTSYCEVLSESR